MKDPFDSLYFSNDAVPLDLVDMIKKDLSKRLRIVFTKTHILYLVCRRKFLCCKENWKKQYNSQNFVYHTSTKMILKELDVVNILNKLRNLDTIINLLLTEDQRQILKIQKKNTFNRRAEF